MILCDWRNAAFAWGVYNTDSMFKIRILQLDREVRPTLVIVSYSLLCLSSVQQVEPKPGPSHLLSLIHI